MKCWDAGSDPSHYCRADSEIQQKTEFDIAMRNIARSACILLDIFFNIKTVRCTTSAECREYYRWADFTCKDAVTMTECWRTRHARLPGQCSEKASYAKFRLRIDPVRTKRSLHSSGLVDRRRNAMRKGSHK
jgi:hypothetical protein